MNIWCETTFQITGYGQVFLNLPLKIPCLASPLVGKENNILKNTGAPKGTLSHPVPNKANYFHAWLTVTRGVTIFNKTAFLMWKKNPSLKNKQRTVHSVSVSYPKDQMISIHPGIIFNTVCY